MPISLQKTCETSIQGNSPRPREPPQSFEPPFKEKEKEGEGGHHAWWSKEDPMLGGQ